MPPATDAAAAASARGLFLRDDNLYGCAEATFVALQRSYDFDDAARRPDDARRKPARMC